MPHWLWTDCPSDVYARDVCRSWDGWWEHVQQTLYAELRTAREQAEAAAEKARLYAELRAAARVRAPASQTEALGPCVLRRPALAGPRAMALASSQSNAMLAASWLAEALLAGL